MRKILEFCHCPRSLMNRLSPPTYEDLKQAILRSDVDKLSDLLDDKASISEQGETILHFAVREKNLQIVRFICQNEKGIIDQRNEDGDNAFMIAIFARHKEEIEYLLPLSNVNIRDSNGNTSFIIAAANGDIPTLRLLLKTNRSNTLVKNFEGQTAIHRASYFGQIHTVQFLIQKTDLKLSQPDRKGNNCLHMACLGISIKCARYILDKVKNAEEILIMENGQGKNPFDLMAEIIGKVLSKPGEVTVESVQEKIYSDTPFEFLKVS